MSDPELEAAQAEHDARVTAYIEAIDRLIERLEK